MIRAPKLVVSRSMYAFDPTPLRLPTERYPNGNWSGSAEFRAVWFKRKRGALVAVMGTYHPMSSVDSLPAESTYEQWVAAANDNRYGGYHEASWDGTALLGTGERVTPDVAARQVEFLTAMLAGFPNVPAGFDGWWAFEKVQR